MTKSELSLTISNTKKEVKWYSALFWSEKEVVGESLVKKVVEVSGGPPLPPYFR